MEFFGETNFFRRELKRFIFSFKDQLIIFFVIYGLCRSATNVSVDTKEFKSKDVFLCMEILQKPWPSKLMYACQEVSGPIKGSNNKFSINSYYSITYTTCSEFQSMDGLT